MNTSGAVLVTGASSGIGAEFARQLAGRGHDTVLVARRAERLEALASELSASHGPRSVALPMDLTEPGAGQALRAETDRLGIDVAGVVNNAGVANHGFFRDEQLDRLKAEVALDVLGVVEISHAFLPRLRERGEGFLINIASMAAYSASPTMAVYGASKAFVLSFTEALWYEERGSGVTVFAVSPGATQTEFFDVAGESASGNARRMPASAVVRTALGALDRRNSQPSVIVGGGNRVVAGVSRLLGRRRMTRTVGRTMTRAMAQGR
ncbi:MULTISPECIES: SDR family NAD(P)-dependent oxidoreductase [unclassified Streptomyces]|uniref:SDR family NAD(P)-dependent oxidoreductase n=1 Tax=unclassified Streptomyces TaxID=2593676 RepID=UPI000F6F7BC9|nr:MULTISPECIES: SDR family oxidoreductase [unclassified Streptomyces]AZM60247.1 oxidoreductase [Streptomyces sp. WAC 01438]RSM97985.1 oxidoreductase [Streptomyces sp. WAC 01420]